MSFFASFFFSSNDESCIIIIYVIQAGENTQLCVIIKLRNNNAVPKRIVEEALHQTIQEDNTTAITNLQLAIVNAPTISDTERENALRVRLLNTQGNEVSSNSIKKYLYQLGLIKDFLYLSYLARQIFVQWKKFNIIF